MGGRPAERAVLGGGLTAGTVASGAPAEIIVVGLGPGDPGLVTEETRRAIESVPTHYVRTARHPSVGVLGDALAFDDLYERADTFEEVYGRIVAVLLEAAAEHGRVLYAVPGSPHVAESTVELLRAAAVASGDHGPLAVRVLPALSFVDLAWARLGIDPFAAGARLVDGHRFELEAAGQDGPFLVAQCDRPDVLSAVKLALPPSAPVTVLARLGLADERVEVVEALELDRASVVVPDHLTAVWVPRQAAPVASEVTALVRLMETLRERCPWDREQTHRSLGRHLLEETYEVLDAIEALPDPDAPSAADAWGHLEEELGDLLFQVVFHARLGAEEGRFELADVARGVHDKLVARHPHVFGAEQESGVAALERSWEERKKAEKQRTSVMEGMPSALPALAYAVKVQRKAAGLGLDWPDPAGVWAKLDEELGELRAVLTGSAPSAAVEGELGDVLFTVANLARKLDLEPESALRAATAKVRDRVMTVERLATAAGVRPADVGAAQLDRWWEQAKAAEGDRRPD